MRRLTTSVIALLFLGCGGALAYKRQYPPHPLVKHCHAQKHKWVCTRE